MPRTRVTQQVPATCAEAFELLHDYARRLDWDPFLRSAEVLGPGRVAGPNVVTRCSARARFGGLAMETRYVSWQPAKVAAVKMTGRTPFFQRFAASIRHHATENGDSQVTYVFSFAARPRLFRWLLEPIMNWVLRRETEQRLRALARALETRKSDRGWARASRRGAALDPH